MEHCLNGRGVSCDTHPRIQFGRLINGFTLLSATNSLLETRIDSMKRVLSKAFSLPHFLGVFKPAQMGFTSRATVLTLAASILSLHCTAEDTKQAKPTTGSQNHTLVNTTNTPHPAPAKSDTVLRHAVFFSFNENSSDADVQKVVKAFAALPKKIDAIIDFQSGINNSPEGLDDGFTHCFLLTFKDEEGRETYLPHPAHREFGATLRPHLNDVFVIDYWGEMPDPAPKRQLKHAVFFKFKEDADPAAIKQVEEAFAALPSKIDSIKSFEWGTNNSPETHDDDFTHCFMVTFDSEEGREKYLPHPDHLQFVEVLKPVLDKVRVLDFWEDGFRKNRKKK